MSNVKNYFHFILTWFFFPLICNIISVCQIYIGELFKHKFIEVYSYSELNSNCSALTIEAVRKLLIDGS